MQHQEFDDSKFLLVAQQVEATFPDGSVLQTSLDSSLSPSHLALHEETPLGTEIWITDNTTTSADSNDSSPSRIIRLIFIDPSQDWRANSTYSWKLDSAWISNPKSTNDDNEYDWFHWNVQSFIDSDIQVPPNAAKPWVWECDQLEVSFHRLLSPNYRRIQPSSKVVLKGVQIGFGTDSLQDGKVYSPCPEGSTQCSIVDGLVTNSVRGSLFDTGATNMGVWVQDALLGIVLLLVSVMLGLWCWRKQRLAAYSKLSPTVETDLTLQVEDSYQSSFPPRSTIEGVVNETG